MRISARLRLGQWAVLVIANGVLAIFSEDWPLFAWIMLGISGWTLVGYTVMRLINSGQGWLWRQEWLAAWPVGRKTGALAALIFLNGLLTMVAAVFAQPWRTMLLLGSWSAVMYVGVILATDIKRARASRPRETR